MSSVSGISSSASQSQTATQANYYELVQDFAAMGAALQSGNLTNAQTAMTALERSLPGNLQGSNARLFGTNSQANTDFEKLINALQSGNLPNAQQSFTSLEKDLKPVDGHHLHSQSNGSSSAEGAASLAKSVWTELLTLTGGGSAPGSTTNGATSGGKISSNPLSTLL